MRKKLIKEEINKMLLMMNYDSSKSLSEQTTSYGVCGGNNNIDNPMVNITKFANASTQKEPFVGVVFNFKIFFGSTVSATDVYNSTLNQLKEQIKSKIEADGLDPNEWDLDKLSNFTLTKVVGSASNYLNGPLQPTVDNNGNPLDVSQDPYSSLPSTGRNYDNNFSFAQGRLNDFINFLNVMSVESSVDNANITTVITDTGGCTDETRNIDSYPNPGQYLEVLGTVKVSKILPVLEKSCVSNLQIIVGYFDSPTKVNGIEMPKSSSEHKCNHAIFDIFLNNKKIGTSNMNNDEGLMGRFLKTFKDGQQGYIRNTDIGADGPNQKYTPPTSVGGTVYTQISVPEQILEELGSAGSDILLSMKATPNQYFDNTPSLGKTVHGDAPTVCIYTNEDDGSKRIIYLSNNPFGSTGETAGRISKNEEVNLTYFNPCKVS